jgi:hypothetical protein
MRTCWWDGWSARSWTRGRHGGRHGATGGDAGGREQDGVTGGGRGYGCGCGHGCGHGLGCGPGRTRRDQLRAGIPPSLPWASSRRPVPGSITNSLSANVRRSVRECLRLSQIEWNQRSPLRRAAMWPASPVPRSHRCELSRDARASLVPRPRRDCPGTALVSPWCRAGAAPPPCYAPTDPPEPMTHCHGHSPLRPL